MSWLSSLGPVGEAIRFIILVFEVLLVFNLMILVHEWGHFLAARWRGLRVEAFYIWFGKPLWKKTINGVEYGLGSIPAGGFVKLPQMAPMDAIEGSSNSSEPLPPISPLDKIIVAFAGPLFSFLLACAFAVLVSWLGKPETESNTTTIIGYVAKDSPASRAGLKPGDRIIEIDDHPILRFEGFVDSVRWAIVSSERPTIEFLIDRPGSGEMRIEVTPEIIEEKKAWWKSIFARPPLRSVGLVGRESVMVGEVQENSPAQDCGLKPKDIILSMDGIALHSVRQFMDYIAAQAGKPLSLLVKRDGQEQTLQIQPRLPDIRPADFKDYKVGILFHGDGIRKYNHPTVYEQVSMASRSLYNTIGKLLSQKSEIGLSHMSGPLGIGRVYYNLLLDPDALLLVLWFSVVLNINLAIMNMLPFPVLDGGHIVMAIGEAIRRRPLQGRFLEVVQTACVLLLFGFMIFVSLKDSGDIAQSATQGAPPPPPELGWLPEGKRTEATK